jgi:hypothetical protein
MTEPMPDSPKKMSATRAVALGQLMVNVPAVAILLTAIYIGRSLFPDKAIFFAAGGFIVAWLYWSYSVARWHKWAINKGVDQIQLSRLAIMTGLMWKAQLMPGKSDLDNDEDDDD